MREISATNSGGETAEFVVAFQTAVPVAQINFGRRLLLIRLPLWLASSATLARREIFLRSDQKFSLRATGPSSRTRTTYLGRAPGERDLFRFGSRCERVRIYHVRSLVLIVSRAGWRSHHAVGHIRVPYRKARHQIVPWSKRPSPRNAVYGDLGIWLGNESRHDGALAV